MATIQRVCSALIQAAALVVPLSAAISNLRVTGTTSTQAVISYTAPDTSACTVEVSTDPSYSTLIHDVNPSLFSGSNSDTRAGSISVGRQRMFVIGRRTVAEASDGKFYSRALETDRLHYLRVTCGADQATGTFNTSTIRLGNTRTDVYPADGSGGYVWPTIDHANPQKMIDPLTGVPLYVIMKPRDYVADTTLSMDAASGTDWTTPENAMASDDAYASVSTTDPLLVVASITSVGFGQSGDDAMDFIRWEIEGFGAGATDSERTVNVCLTRDNGLTCSANKQAILPTTDGTVFAGDATAGEFWETKPWVLDERKPGAAWVKTATDAASTDITFLDSGDCQRLRVGSTIQLFPKDSTTLTTLTISSLACPAAVVDTSVNLYNGGKGLPFTTPSGIGAGANTALSPNKGFGVKIAKANADGQAINIDRVRLVLGKSSQFRMSSGGFHNQCSLKDTANGGWYKCFASSSGNPLTEMYAIRVGSDGEPEIRNMGGPRFTGSSVGCSLTFFYPGTFGFGARPWDGADSNVIWALCGGSRVGKATFTNTTYTAKAPGGIPIADFSVLDFLGTYNLDTLIKDFMTANGIFYDPYYGTDWSLDGVQGNYLILFNRMGNQDTFAWAAILDVGNKSPLGGGWVGSGGGTNPAATDGTGFVVAAAALYDRAASRWCTLHTYEWVGHEPVICPEVQTAGKITAYGIGPYKTTLQTSMPSSSASMDITVSSTWDDTTFRTPTFGPTELNSSGTTVTPVSGSLKELLYIGSKIQAQSQTRTVTAVGPGNAVTIDSAFSPDLSAASFTYSFPTKPAWWKPGDPIGDRAPWALTSIQPGDRLLVDSELLTVLSRTENASDLTLTVQRGTPDSHSVGATIQARCNSDYANYWFFTQDKTAGNTTYYAEYDALQIGHGTYMKGGLRVQADWQIQFDEITDFARWNIKTHHMKVDPSFHGKTAPAAGNSYQKHPSTTHFETSWPVNRTFFDVVPLQGTNLFSPQNNTAATLVSGFNNVYKYSYTENPRTIEYKYFAAFGVAGSKPLKDISAPSSSLADGDHYKMCVVHRAGECVSGSAAGDIYLNIPNLVQSLRYCAAGETSIGGADNEDACAGERSMFGQSVMQGGVLKPKVVGTVVNDNIAEFSRVLATAFQPYRITSTTANAQGTPGGEYIHFAGRAPPDHAWWMLAKVPAFPPIDSMNRSRFVPTPVTLTPPSGLGVHNAIVEFGYNESLYCTERTEVCVKDASDPYVFAGDTITGVSCASGCTISIPAISGRVLYYRWKYRDAADVVIATSATQVFVVP